METTGGGVALLDSKVGYLQNPAYPQVLEIQVSQVSQVSGLSPGTRNTGGENEKYRNTNAKPDKKLAAQKTN